MSDAELKELKKLIFNTAKYYGREINPEVITMMADDLSDLGFSDVLNAYTLYRRDPKNRSMPLPAQIRDLISPTMTPIAEAREILERIKHAISKFGYASGKLAHEYIGDVGWRSVQRQGGWHAICESDIHVNAARQAQMRDVIADQIQYGAKLGQSQVFQTLPFNEGEVFGVQDRESTKMIELDSQRNNQLKEFMEKFNLNSEKLKEGTK